MRVCIYTPHITQFYTESRTGNNSLEGPTRQYYISLEGFVATEFNEIFSGQTAVSRREGDFFFRSFRDRAHLQSVAGGLAVFGSIKSPATR